MKQRSPVVENIFIKGRTEWGNQQVGALLGGAGNSTTYLGSYLNKNFFEFRLQSNYAGGDIRGMYMRVKYAGAGAGGEAIRAYTQATAAVATVHGAHITGEIAAGGSVTGLIVGCRCTAATAADLTLSGGTMAALQIDTSLLSAVTGMTSASLIRIAEAEANKMPYFLVSDGMTGCLLGEACGTTPQDALKVNINGTTYYIPLMTTAE